MTKEELKARFLDNRGEYNATRHIYLTDPRSIHDMERLTYNGNSADRYIAEAKALIETMEAYQQLLFDRAQELTTTPYHHEIHLTREKRWKGNVLYHLTLKKVYDGDTINPETVEHTVFAGSERHKAITAFNDYQKTHAGIIAVKNIEKGRWE